MELISKRGTFTSLQTLRAAYIKAPDRKQFRIYYDGGGWDKSLLHASDIGGCPRAVAYRLLGTPEKPRSESSAANREVMFWAGYEFHFLTYSALSWAGLLEEHEILVPMPPGWSAHADAVIRPNWESDFVIGFDEKTVLPNMLTYHRQDTPKVKDCLQVTGYAPGLSIEDWLIEYTDRAGSNRPELCYVDVRKWSNQAIVRMRAMEDARDHLPELPPTLEPVYVPHYTKVNNQMVFDSVTLETPWECQYCDYHLTNKEKRTNPNSGRLKEHSWTSRDSTCQPVNLPPLSVALWKMGKLANVRSGHEEALAAWMSGQLLVYPVPEEDK